ncbi:LamG-like jellyroll fold domain-containing protein [Streptomyces sp. NPDC058685]|uniref:LamG-like jellyroll fold domain-containing protein n=1 Tax=Streptomyces sp. NPDC058685 TaxID=3346598 RepID=UPI003665903A
MRALRVRRSAIIAVACALLAGVSPAQAVAAAPEQPARAAAGGSKSASALAAESGEPVEVVSERSAYTTTEANPDGTFTLTQSTTPQRVKAADDSWRDVDVTLERRSDGSVGPKAAVVDLSFSGGGSGKNMIHMAAPQGSVTLGWPDQLPAPTLKGATATYPEVLAGVDLQLTATAEGYREVLVVKTAEAAGNPELNKVELTTASDGLTITPSAGGGLSAVDGNGNTVFNGPAGLMWDSAGSAGVQPQVVRSTVASADDPAEGDAPEAVAPDKGDATAVMPVQVSDSAVAVTPDTNVLRGEDTVYPVYIDPSMGLGVSERTVLSSDGDTFWNFTGDLGVGNCNHLGPWYCGTDYTNRMYFEFAPTKLAGKYVIDATFRAYETWSFSCSAQWLDLYRTNNISSATRWPGPSQLDLLVDRQVSAGRGDLCTPDQPDSWIDFNDTASEADENLTKTVRSFADGNFSRLTLMLRAKDENNPDAWKRFNQNAELKVVYAMKPGVPTDMGVIRGISGKVQGCGTTEASAEIATVPTPMLQARAQTQVAPAASDEHGSLRVYHHAEKKQTNGTWATAWTAEDPPTGYQVDNYLSKRQMNAGADGSVYRVKFWTKSFWTYEGKLNGISSTPTVWCYYKIDTTRAKQPQITSNGPYTECTADACVGAGGPGQAGSFTIKPNPADTDIIAYEWRLLTESAAQTHRETRLGVDGSVTINSVPTTSGAQALLVQAVDRANLPGPPGEFHFKVEQGTDAVSRWHFAEGTGKEAADSGTGAANGGHKITLSDTAATWFNHGRGGENDDSLRLNEQVSDPAKRIGHGTTATPPINTKDSFAVSAWVRLTDGGKTSVVASAPGTATSAAFNLFYSGSAKKWVFNRAVADVATPAYVSSLADAPNPPLNVWTHLTGVFDAKNDTDKSNDTIQLFVNGRPQGDAVELLKNNGAYTPWTSSAGMIVGASKAGEYFTGGLDEIAVWQRALSGDEVRLENQLQDADGQPAVELVANWDAAAAAGGSIPDIGPYAPDLNISPTGAVADPALGGVRFDGVAGYVSAAGPIVDESGSFTVSVNVSLNQHKFQAMPVGAKAYVSGQATPNDKESSWALWVEKRNSDLYLWQFSRTAIGPTGQVTITASAESEESAALDSQVQVTGVFNATEDTGAGFGQAHLYLSSTHQMFVPFTAVQQGSGEIAAGRGTSGGVKGHYLPGVLTSMRVWAGAMARNQIEPMVLGTLAAN